MSGTRRFALQQLEKAADQAPVLPEAEVTAIATGAGTDGLDVVTVKFLGATLKCAHMTSYTPVVGHVVAMGRYAGNWIVLGRPGGFPTAP